MGRLDGKIIVITAAANGIGRASALAFHAEGAIVYASDVDLVKLREIEQPGRLICNKLDVTDKNAIEEYANSIEKVDVLFNVAGYIHHGSLLDTEEKDWDLTMNINIKSMFLMCKAFLPKMIAGGGGSIINMSSVVGVKIAAVVRFAYQTSKAAVVGLTKSIAADYSKDKIRCNCIQPGTINTPSLNDRINKNAKMSPEEALKMFEARTPAGRFGRPEEVAHIAVFLASDESAFVTGGEHIIDGGWSLV